MIFTSRTRSPKTSLLILRTNCSMKKEKKGTGKTDPGAAKKKSKGETKGSSKESPKGESKKPSKGASKGKKTKSKNKNKKNSETDKSSDAETSETSDRKKKIEVIVMENGKRSVKKACEFVGLKMPPIKSSLQMVCDQVSDNGDTVSDSD